MKSNRSVLRVTAWAAMHVHRPGWAIVATVVAALTFVTTLRFANDLRDGLGTYLGRESVRASLFLAHERGGFMVAMCRQRDGACAPGSGNARRAI